MFSLEHMFAKCISKGCWSVSCLGSQGSQREKEIWTYLLLQCCGVPMISISYAVTSSAGRGYVTCVENFQVSCIAEQAGFWLSQLTFTAGPSYFPLPWKICGLHCSWPPWIGSDLFPPDSQYQQCSGISYVQVPLNSAVSCISCE